MAERPERAAFLSLSLIHISALEIYVSGSLNVFNHETNVDLNRRLVCLDLKKLGAGLRTDVYKRQVWDIRCCCVLPYSKQAVLQNPSSAAIKSCLLYTSISHAAPDRPDGVAVGGDTLDQHRIDGDTD